MDSLTSAATTRQFLKATTSNRYGRRKRLWGAMADTFHCYSKVKEKEKQYGGTGDKRTRIYTEGILQFSVLSGFLFVICLPT
jgi:hypothetical protein